MALPVVRPDASRYVVFDWAEATPAAVIAITSAALIPKSFFIVLPAQSVIIIMLMIAILIIFCGCVYFAGDELAQRVESAF